jgi:hypothetical protein
MVLASPAGAAASNKTLEGLEPIAMLHVALTILVLAGCAGAVAVVGFGFFDAFSRRSRSSNKNPGQLRD